MMSEGPNSTGKGKFLESKVVQAGGKKGGKP